ncbi:MAG TPA: GAF domain-containing protein [Thermodesulfobacteriota bacterium]
MTPPDARPADAETRALFALADTVVRGLSTEEVLGRVVEEVERLFSARAVWLYLLDETSDRLAVRAARTPHAGNLIPFDVAPGEGLVWTAFETRRLTVVADVGTDARMRHGEAYAAAGIREAVLVPLVHAGRSTGVLVFCPREGWGGEAPDARRLAMLALFAAHAAVAIQNAAAHAEAVAARARAERGTRRLAAIQRLEEAVALVSDLPSLLGRAASLAAAALGARRGAVALAEWPEWRRGRGRIVFGTATEVWADLPWRSLPLGRRDDVLGLLEGRRGGVVLQHPADDPRLGRLRRFIGPSDTQQILIAPVRSGDRLLGVLAVDDGARGGAEATARIAFGPEEMALLESLGARLGAAVDRLHLVESERRRSRELLALQRATQHLATALTRPILLPLVVEEAAKLLEADAALLRLREGDELVLAAHTADLAACHTTDRVPIHGSVSGLVASRGGPVTIRDLDRDERTHNRPLWQSRGFRSYLGVPIRTDGRVAGVLGFYSRGRRRFETRDIELANTLADVVAVALENAHLFERLSLASREWEASFNAMQDGIALLDADGRIVRANEALARLLGVAPGGLVGRRFADAAPGLRPGAEGTHDGRTLALSVSELTDDAGRPVGAVHAVRDVTAERRLQEQLLQSEKLASVGQLVSGVAHELNNPLAAIMGYCELILPRVAGDAGLAQDVSQVRLQTERASRIVHNLLAFARKRTPEVRAVSLNEVVEAALELQAYDLKVSGVEVETALEAGLPAVMADFHQMEDVVVNVLVNAKQAIAAEKPEGRIRVETRAIRTPQGVVGVRLAIRDNGPGIPREHLHRVFDPFFTTKPVGVGTGLGLSICFGVVQSHGGRIWAESQPGAGTTIVVELPTADQAREAPGTPVPASVAERPAADQLRPLAPSYVLDGVHAEPLRTRRGAAPRTLPEPRPPAGRLPGVPLRVLVVDDEEVVRHVVSAMLALEGYEAQTAEDGVAAAAHLAAEPFDLVLADVRMPGMGGLELADWIAAHRPALFDRILFMTGDTVGASTGALIEATGRPCLAKPFTRDALMTAVRAAME